MNPILDSVLTGFHSMVEFLLAVGLNPQELTDMLSEAVNSRRKDLVRLLIDHGADVRSVTL